jgi:hypothetical protein
MKIHGTGGCSTMIRRMMIAEVPLLESVAESRWMVR